MKDDGFTQVSVGRDWFCRTYFDGEFVYYSRVDIGLKAYIKMTQEGWVVMRGNVNSDRVYPGSRMVSQYDELSGARAALLIVLATL